MARNDLRWTALLWTLGILASTSTASAQYLGAGDPCGCGPAVAAQPVFQTCYQTVPVTEFKREERTVRRPVVETKYVDKPITVYKPVTEERVVEVPTVQYRNVTEYRTVHRDCGRWTTHHQPVCRVSPCEYDRRPGFLGWMNRTSYSMRSAFAPRYVTSRQYHPNVVAQQIPYTRQVAVRGTRQVRQQYTRMVATRETRKVAVNRVRYVADKVTVMKPVTAYRTVPIGTSVAYGYGGSRYAYSPYGSAVAWGAPVIDDTTSRRTTERPAPEPDTAFKRRASSEPRRRSASSGNSNYSGEESFEDDLDRSSDGGFRRNSRGTSADPASLELDLDSDFHGGPSVRLDDSRRIDNSRRTGFRRADSVPSVVRASGWRRSRDHAPRAANREVAVEGPRLTLVSNVRR